MSLQRLTAREEGIIMPRDRSEYFKKLHIRKQMEKSLDRTDICGKDDSTPALAVARMREKGEHLGSILQQNEREGVGCYG